MRIVGGNGGGDACVGATPPSYDEARAKRGYALDAAMRWVCCGPGQTLTAAQMVEAAKVFEAYLDGTTHRVEAAKAFGDYLDGTATADVDNSA